MFVAFVDVIVKFVLLYCNGYDYISEMCSSWVVDVLVRILKMDRLVRLFYGGKVKGNGEFESMQEHVQFFSTPPTFDGLVSQC